MELKEFVKKVLLDLVDGVEEARSEAVRDMKLSDSKEHRTVEFDVAVTTETTDKKSGKAGIRVLQFAEGGGDLSKENKNTTVSRIQFGVHIASWTKEQEAQSRVQFEARRPRINEAR